MKTDSEEIKGMIRSRFFWAMPCPAFLHKLLENKSSGRIVTYAPDGSMDGDWICFGYGLFDLIYDRDGKWWITWPGLAKMCFEYWRDNAS